MQSPPFAQPAALLAATLTLTTTVISTTALAQVSISVEALAPIVTSATSGGPGMTDVTPGGVLPVNFTQTTEIGAAGSPSNTIASFQSIIDGRQLTIDSLARATPGASTSMARSGPVDLLIEIAFPDPSVGSIRFELTTLLTQPGALSIASLDVDNDGVADITGGFLELDLATITSPALLRFRAETSAQQASGSQLPAMEADTHLEINVNVSTCDFEVITGQECIGLPSLIVGASESLDSINFRILSPGVAQSASTRLLIIGFQVATTPILLNPAIPCALVVSPDIVANVQSVNPGSGTLTELNISLPSLGSGPLTFFAQGVALQSIGIRTTQAIRIDCQL